MADLTSQTTFNHLIMGNKRVEICDVSGTGGTTFDSFVVPLSRVESVIGAAFRTTAGTSVAPSVGFAGTTVVVFQPTATTGINYTVTVIGR